MNTESLMTVSQFAEKYIGEKGKKVSRQQIHNLITNGKIKAIRIGRDYLIDKKYLSK